MRNTAVLLVAVLLSSCVTQLAYVENDDMYVTRHYDAHTNTHVWTEVVSNYIQPSYYNPYFYQQVYVRPIVVTPDKNYQYGKRYDRGSVPSQQQPRIQSKQAPVGGLPRRGRN